MPAAVLMVGRVLGSGPGRVDTSWPPVLVLAVLVAVSVGVLSIVVVLRKLRAEVRGARRHERSIR